MVPASLKRALLKTKPGRRLAEWDVRGQAYEPELTAALERMVEPGWTCADVGAHEGRITRLLARLVGPTGTVIAFEAHPGNAASLAVAVAREGTEADVRVQNVAITDGSRSHASLHAGRNRASAEWNVVGTDVDGRVTEAELAVAATSLDAYFAAEPGRLDFVKIDVEGAESQVLAGMSRLLRETRPALAIEFHHEEGWASRTRLLEAGYDLYTVDGRRLENPYDADRLYHCLALPHEGPQELSRR